MRCETVEVVGGVPVVLMDSISLIGPQHRGTIVICGSHGGSISGAFAAGNPPALVIFNDAGGGKLDAGRAAIAMLDGVGVACVTVSHRSARIGDAADAWSNGVLSAAGETARQCGLEPGLPVREAVRRFAERISTGGDRK
jgi:hypothetical protein